MEKQVEARFGRHPDAEIYLSQPGLGVVLSARVLAEFGDDKTRYTDARARKNYAGTSPLTRHSGKKKLVLARYVHTTTASSTPSACKHSPPYAPPPAPAPTTNRCGSAA
jgi:hypothetical protein